MPNSPSNSRVSTELFTLTRQTGKNKPKIIVSKKVARLAVDRNRIKRVIKEAIRTQENKNAYTIIVKKNISDKKTEEVKSILTQYLK